MDLLGEFPGGNEDQATGASRCDRAVLRELGEHRQAEPEGLAGAGARPPEHVLTGEDVGKGRGLYRERGGDPLPGESGDEGGGQARVREGADRRPWLAGRQGRVRGRGEPVRSVLLATRTRSAAAAIGGTSCGPGAAAGRRGLSITVLRQGSSVRRVEVAEGNRGDCVAAVVCPLRAASPEHERVNPHRGSHRPAVTRTSDVWLENHTSWTARGRQRSQGTPITTAGAKGGAPAGGETSPTRRVREGDTGRRRSRQRAGHDGRPVTAAGRSRNRRVTTASRSQQQVGQQMDDQTGERPHHRAVDADVLQVATHVQFDLDGGLGRFPVRDRVGDHRGDVGPVPPDEP